jgi:hypothetical protein
LNRFVSQDRQDVQFDSISQYEPHSNRFVLQDFVFFGPVSFAAHDSAWPPPDARLGTCANRADAPAAIDVDTLVAHRHTSGSSRAMLAPLRGRAELGSRDARKLSVVGKFEDEG